MKTEYELRILEIDRDEWISKLEKLNAEFIGSWHQKRYVYDFNPRNENKWIRLRTNGINTTLTIKNVEKTTIDGTKELEIEVSSFEDTNKILEELGYFKRSVQENKRIRYMLDGVELDIDTWPKIPTYVEIEGKNEEEIMRALEKLNCKLEDTTTKDVQSIYLDYGFKEEDLDNLNFEEV